MKNYGFIRVAAATPTVKVADVSFNTAGIKDLIDKAETMEVALVVFPELCVTGYTCADLFGSAALAEAAEKAVASIRDFTRGKHVTAVVGTPVRFRDRLYNCAAVIRNGQINGLVPKISIPSYNEYYETRWFSSGADFLSPTANGGAPLKDDGRDFFKVAFPGEITFAGHRCTISPNLLFCIGETAFAVEICEDLWSPLPPSTFHAVAGARIIANLSASNETVQKHSYRHGMVREQSAKTLSAYIYSSAGYGESTQDAVFAGASMIYEDGCLLAEGERFRMEASLTVADVDVEKLEVLRRKQSSFNYVTPDGKTAASCSGLYGRIPLGDAVNTDFEKSFFRHVEAHPFIPSDGESAARCREILDIQVLALATRLKHVGARAAVIGISGGLDSTLALLVSVMAFDRLGWPRKGIIGVTMPGLGTSSRTRTNADDLMEALGISARAISVVPAVEQHFKDIGHDPKVMDSTYENAQARERTQILMDIANQCGGLVVGTGDLSEMALGWCTYNGDHMSMYGVNASVPKTLVKSICREVAGMDLQGGSFGGRSVKDILLDIVDTPISPELTPADKSGKIAQLTEELVGPYELHDFFLYHFFRFGATPSKILFLAGKAFAGSYDEETVKHWLKVFFKRFFTQQFKRSCVPDGPKVGSVSLSPRGDWRMPSDASSALFLSELD